MPTILQKLKVRGSAKEVRGEQVHKVPTGASHQAGGQLLHLSNEALTNLLDKAKELDTIKATMADKGPLLHGMPTPPLPSSSTVSNAKSLEDYEKEAMEKIAQKQANALDAAMKRPAARKPAAKAKAVTKTKVAKDQTKHAQKTKHVTPAFLKKIYGCTRCRGNVAGCDVCRSPYFNGKRFSSRAEYNKWYQQKQTNNRK